MFKGSTWNVSSITGHISKADWGKRDVVLVHHWTFLPRHPGIDYYPVIVLVPSCDLRFAAVLRMRLGGNMSCS
jgi:hypothetical protein